MGMKLVQTPGSQWYGDPAPVTAATETPREEGAPTSPIAGRRFHAVLCVEATWTGDGRYWEPGAFVWRDLPLPLMADDENHEAHLEAKTIGSIDRIERHGVEIHAWGAYVTVTADTDPQVLHLLDLIAQGHLRGVSFDGSDPEFEVIIPAEMMSEGTVDDDGDLHIAGAFPKQVYSSTKIIGATVLPFPALEQAFIEDDDTPLASAIAASIGRTGMLWLDQPPTPITAAATVELVAIPIIPPAAWFDPPQFDDVTPLTISDQGQVRGHLAAWGTCHVGSPPGECIEPPTSATDYAHFLLGEIKVDDGTRVAVGKITMNTGHADLTLTASAHWWDELAPLAMTASAATAHYDHTGTVVAHVTCGEDQYGIWLAGALMPGLDPISVRRLMGSDLSGDWRRVGRSLELVAMLAVNVPGFAKLRGRNKGRCRVRQSEGMVASLQWVWPVQAATLTASARSAIVDRIARTIGRSTEQRRQAIIGRVHGGAR